MPEEGRADARHGDGHLPALCDAGGRRAKGCADIVGNRVKQKVQKELVCRLVQKRYALAVWKREKKSS